MPRISPAELREIATLARLRLDDAEIEKMAHEMEAILGHIEAVQKLDLANVEPMTHAVPFACPLRDDQAAPGLPVEEALRNAPRREGNFFQVPRIMPGPGGAGGGQG